MQVRIRIVKKKKKKKAILSTTTENLVTPAPPAPDKGSIREIATGEITVSITPDDHFECPYLLDPIRMRRIACFRHTHTIIGLLAIIYNSFFSSFWSVCKTFFRRKSTQILARSLRSLDIIFLMFLVF